MPRDAYKLPLHEYLRLRLDDFLRTVRACGLPVNEDEAKNNYPLWERDYHFFHQQAAA
jgi:hypothetical protein